jgi:uncharacterized Zn finger protein
MIMELGAHALARGIYQIEHSHDEGETAGEIQRVMAIVFEAALQSRVPVAQRLLWQIDLQLKDDYGILDGLKGPVESYATRHRVVWSEVADKLAQRLAQFPKPPAGARQHFSSKYKRENIMMWCIRALENAGRRDEVIPLLEREADITHCYVNLFDRLTADGRNKEAYTWAKRGFDATRGEWSGIAWSLEERLRKQAENEKNQPLVAAFRAFEFFDQPDFARYVQLEKAATAAQVWDAIRGPVMTFLETGRRPDCESTGGKVRAPAPSWPLPSTGLEHQGALGRGRNFPVVELLIDIAIKDGRPGDVLKWYRKVSNPHGFYHDGTGDRVAGAIQKAYPKEALAIWKTLVAGALKFANAGEYTKAGQYLTKIKRLYEHNKQRSEWDMYIEQIRQQNRRRPRMMEVLNALEGGKRRILD